MDSPSKRQALVWILVGAFILGLGIGFFPDDSPSERAWNLAAGLVLLIPQMRWFVVDAKLHGYRISGPMFLCLVALMVFTAPFYFFATRRWGFWKSLLKSVAFLLMILLVGALGDLAMEGILRLLRH